MVQCERLFRPELSSQALIILESVVHQKNDYLRLLGCSTQARELGFNLNLGSEQLTQLLNQLTERVIQNKEHQTLVQTQANKELYSDMSERLFSSLEMLSPSVIPLASDEACLDLTKLKRIAGLIPHQKSISEKFVHQAVEQLHRFANELRDSIKQWLGLEVFVGVGTTKTLAYLGCKAAEHEFGQRPHDRTQNQGTTVLTSSKLNQPILANFPVTKIKGIGPKALSKLSELGIHTALELSQTSSQLVGKRCSLLVEHIAIELSGLPSQPTSDQPFSEKGTPSVIKTKQRNRLMESEIQGHLANYANARLKADLKGRFKNGGHTTLLRITLAMLTNAHKEMITRQLNCHKLVIAFEKADYHAPDEALIECKSLSLSEPGNALGSIKKLCRQILESIYSDDAHYSAISIMLKCRNQNKAKQVGMFDAINKPLNIAQLSIDQDEFVLVQRYCELNDRSKQKKVPNYYKSPSYTTQWHELLRVN